MPNKIEEKQQNCKHASLNMMGIGKTMTEAYEMSENNRIWDTCFIPQENGTFECTKCGLKVNSYQETINEIGKKIKAEYK